MFLHIAATNQTVSGMLVAEREQEQAKQKKATSDTTGKPRVVQFPVYYFSSMPRDTKEGYLEFQKILLGVVLAARKLRHYFKTHPITLQTSYPLQRML